MVGALELRLHGPFKQIQKSAGKSTAFESKREFSALDAPSAGEAL